MQPSALRAKQKKVVFTSGDSDLGVSCKLVQNLRRHGTSAKTQTDSLSGRWDLPANVFVAVYEKYEFPVFTGTHSFLQGELKQGGQNMHFTA